MSLPLTLHTVATPKDLRAFLDVPLAVYRDDPNWVQPLYSERRSHLGPANPFFQHAEVRLRFARDAGGRPVGRISTQIDRLAQKPGCGIEGHFGLLEATTEAVMGALLADAESWLRERGVTRVVGPYSLSVNDESGLLVEGFETPPRLMMNYAPRWYGPALEAHGYAKAKDLCGFLLDLERDLPEGALRIAARAKAVPNFSERRLRLDRFEEEVRNVGAIFNDAWSGNWGYVPLTENEIRHLGQGLKPILDPELARFIEVDGRPEGMVIALADINEAIRGLEGRLMPFGWARLLWRLKTRRVRTARVILMGVNRAWHGHVRNAAMVAALLLALYHALRRRGYRKLEMSWILEDNRRTIAIVELFGGWLEKRYRLYQKQLS